MKAFSKLLIGVTFVATGSALCGEETLKGGSLPTGLEELAGKRVLWLGDSITYAGGYVAAIEYYLNTRAPSSTFEFINVGLGSETVSGLSELNHAGGRFPRPDLRERLDRVLDQIEPEIVFACYGMNCGIQLPFDEERFAKYREGIERLRLAVKERGARMIHVTPPVFDGRGNNDAYSETLDKYSDWLIDQGSKADWEVVDLHFPMKSYLESRRVEDPEFFLQKDRVHPGELGHWVMAKAVLQGLGAEDLDTIDSLEALVSPHPNGAVLKALITERMALMRNAWLSATKHLRPGVPVGLPMEEARTARAALSRQIETLKRISPQGAEEAGKLGGAISTDWKGFHRTDFHANGRDAHVVFPKKAAAGNPWIWRPEFFGHFDYADLALLERGWVVAYVDIRNLFGSPTAMEAMDRFYDTVTEAFGLAPKVVLEGISRGGLYAFNWAALRPEKVACLYGDAPVLDIKSWPGGMGKGSTSVKNWELCLAVYGLTEEEARVFPNNPVDNLEPLAKAGIPILLVSGDADRVVLIEENTLIAEERYKALGGEIKVIIKPGVDHHPHSLEDPQPIVDFILERRLR